MSKTTATVKPVLTFDTMISSTAVPRWSPAWFICGGIRAYNAARRALLPAPHAAVANSEELREIQQLAGVPTDIDEHLELMYAEALLLRPAVIVKLGVRGGTSTFVFERAARACGSHVISVDIEDCSAISSYSRWHFYQGDDVQFAAQFGEFCCERNIPPQLDLPFIDTSHQYEHTVQEIRAWFPLLSSRAKVMFHDTNLNLFGPRRDGCFAVSFDNQRAVVRAIEDCLAVSIQEHRQYVEYAGGWLVRHWPNCNGFTILDRVALESQAPTADGLPGHSQPANALIER